MALDTKQKRGSSVTIALPFRVWLSEPLGSLPVASRLSLLRFMAGTAAEAQQTGSKLRGTVYIDKSIDASAATQEAVSTQVEVP